MIDHGIRTIETSTKEIMSSTWGFYSNISAQEAEEFLSKYGEHGNFLCRRSGTTPGAYTLSVRRKDKVFHYKINNDGECFNLYGEDGFASVPELIDYYRNNDGIFLDENGENVDLINPLFVETSGASLQQERWFYGCISKDETKEMLLKNGSPGSFLIRESQSKPGNYVLSARSEFDVVEFLVEYHDKSFDLSGAKRFSFPSLHSLLDYYKLHPIIHRQTDQQVNICEPLSVTTEKKKSDSVMKAEFERLQQLDRANPASKKEGRRPENKTKNRYKNILPFDHTRVKLRTGKPHIVGSDYINANYIEDDVTGKIYIASQGCMQSILNDFWQMIYQENSRIIIMLTNEVEKGKIKCIRYWPDKGSIMFCGDKTVANVSERSTRDYIIRELHVSRNNDDEPHSGPAKPPRKIFFYQYTEWPDHGVPTDPGSLLQMLQDADNKEKSSFEKPGCPIIHCSAGIGRTGTVVCVDMLINQLRLKGNLNSIDVPGTVEKVRMQRSGMVQTELQYKFIYSVLNYYTEVERKIFSMKKKDQIYSNINEAGLDSKRRTAKGKKK
ncbi:tyrosine-protein phosphatase corkscrew-like isoform X1 [Rhopilema esculentum]|uniref:tyrosine-protein phosphatase corkscrew-like isoform X1 n=2 Tax=Rhopilema esculentum TaxID=499914 RepID=UPI0031D6F8BB